MDSPLPQSDHDLLIKVDTNMSNLVNRFDSFEQNLVSRIVKTEARLDTIDVYHAGIPLKEYDKAYHWVEGLRSNIHLLVILGGGTVAIVGGLISVLIGKWLHLN